MLALTHCFDYASLTEADAVRLGVTQGIVWLTAAFVPAAVTATVWRRFICLRRYGTATVTAEQLLALMQKHAGLRALRLIATTLGLLLGGLVVQLGYMRHTATTLMPW